MHWCVCVLQQTNYYTKIAVKCANSSHCCQSPACRQSNTNAFCFFFFSRTFKNFILCCTLYGSAHASSQSTAQKCTNNALHSEYNKHNKNRLIRDTDYAFFFLATLSTADALQEKSHLDAKHTHTRVRLHTHIFGGDTPSTKKVDRICKSRSKRKRGPEKKPGKLLTLNPLDSKSLMHDWSTASHTNTFFNSTGILKRVFFPNLRIWKKK